MRFASKPFVMALLLLSFSCSSCNASRKTLCLTASIIGLYDIFFAYTAHHMIKKPLGYIFNESVAQHIALASSLPISITAAALTNTYLSERLYIILSHERVSPSYFKQLLVTIKQYLYYSTISTLMLNELSHLQIPTPPQETKKNTPKTALRYETIKAILTNSATHQTALSKELVDECKQLQDVLDILIADKAVSYETLSQCSINQDVHIDMTTLVDFIRTYKDLDTTQTNTIQSVFEEMFKTWNTFSDALYKDIQTLPIRLNALLSFEAYIEMLFKTSLAIK